MTLETSHLLKSPLNLIAFENMSSMSVTLETSHLLKSPLKLTALSNMKLMLVTLETSHWLMSPKLCEAFEAFKFHNLTAFANSSLSAGTNTALEISTERKIARHPRMESKADMALQ